MKTYKLIKTYPGSPSLNSIYEEILGKCGRGSGRMYKNLAKDGCCLDSRYIERHTEYWEEIVKKDYEILTIEPTTKKQCSERYDIPFPNYPIQKDDKIITIKRLSDGEIFTVGDKIYDNHYKINTIINRIYIVDGQIKFVTPQVDAPMREFDPTKKPLFTTEDGVDIFEGDEYCTVLPSWSISGFRKAKKGIDFEGVLKDFSNEKAAEEYSLWNKPTFSIADIENIQSKHGGSYMYYTTMLRYLAEKVKKGL